VAGYDLSFNLRPEEANFVRSLARACQRRASRVDVQLKYRFESPTKLYVSVDGSLFDIEPYVSTLMRELPVFAEGDENSPLPRRRRVRLADRFLRTLALSTSMSIQHIQDVAAYMRGVPHSVTIDVSQRTHLVGRMRLFRSAVTLYLSGLLDPATILEEAHGAAEVMLRELADQRGGEGTFAQLAAKAQNEGIIDEYLFDQLIEMKNLRRRVKHQGQGVSGAKVYDLLIPAISVCQHLAAHFRQVDGVPPPS